MNFIPVTADQCNSQGLTAPQMQRTEIQINIDLIGGIKGKEVLLKGGNIISLGGKHYTNFRLVNEVLERN